jgi:hypothetical protein
VAAEWSRHGHGKHAIWRLCCFGQGIVFSTYKHVEFDAGPLIQLFEVAADRHGHGKALFSTMEKYYQSIFGPKDFEGIGLYVHYIFRDSGRAFF